MAEYIGKHEKNHRGRYIAIDYQTQYRQNGRWTTPTHLQNLKSEGYEPVIESEKTKGRAKRLRNLIEAMNKHAGSMVVQIGTTFKVYARKKSCLEGMPDEDYKTYLT